MPESPAMRWRSRRAFSSSLNVSSPGSTTRESTSMRVSPLATWYSHRSSWLRSLSLPRRKVTREPSGAICGRIRVGPLSGALPVMASRVSLPSGGVDAGAAACAAVAIRVVATMVSRRMRGSGANVPSL